MVRHIAVVGAGYVGLASAWHLLQLGALVTLFDAAPLGMSASGASAGLLHTFTGLTAHPAWRGHQAIQEAHNLLQLASDTLGSPVFRATSILRLAITEKQQENYHQRALEHSEVLWIDAQQTANLVSGIASYPSLLIKNGYCVYGQDYLKGLWQACQQAGAHWKAQEVQSLDELAGFDGVVLATGASVSLASQRAQVAIRPVKGQLLQLKWPTQIPPLSMPVNAHVYCIMAPDGRSCFVGGTYEHHYASSAPDVEVASHLLMPKVAQMLPFLAGAEILAIRAGVRGATPNHRPLMRQIDTKVWLLAGFGSKGLLYHALLARELAEQIMC